MGSLFPIPCLLCVCLVTVQILTHTPPTFLLFLSPLLLPWWAGFGPSDDTCPRLSKVSVSCISISLTTHILDSSGLRTRVARIWPLRHLPLLGPPALGPLVSGFLGELDLDLADHAGATTMMTTDDEDHRHHQHLCHHDHHCATTINTARPRPPPCDHHHHRPATTN